MQSVGPPRRPFSFFDLIWGLKLAPATAKANLKPPRENGAGKVSHTQSNAEMQRSIPSAFPFLNLLDPFRICITILQDLQNLPNLKFTNFTFRRHSSRQNAKRRAHRMIKSTFISIFTNVARDVE